MASSTNTSSTNNSSTNSSSTNKSSTTTTTFPSKSSSSTSTVPAFLRPLSGADAAKKRRSAISAAYAYAADILSQDLKEAGIKDTSAPYLKDDADRGILKRKEEGMEKTLEGFLSPTEIEKQIEETVERVRQRNEPIDKISFKQEGWNLHENPAFDGPFLLDV